LLGQVWPSNPNNGQTLNFDKALESAIFFLEKNRLQGLTKLPDGPIVQRNNAALHKGDSHEPAE
jgi:hypothetical protein